MAPYEIGSMDQWLQKCQAILLVAKLYRNHGKLMKRYFVLRPYLGSWNFVFNFNVWRKIIHLSMILSWNSRLVDSLGLLVRIYQVEICFFMQSLAWIITNIITLEEFHSKLLVFKHRMKPQDKDEEQLVF